MTDLQTAFYIIGIIFFVLWIFFGLMLIAFFVRVRTSIERFQQNVKDRVNDVFEMIGIVVPKYIIRRIKEWSREIKGEE